jgi:hypothetical protein
MIYVSRFHIHCYSVAGHSVAGPSSDSRREAGGTGHGVSGDTGIFMQISFEEVAEQLSKLDRMYFEMDGSFVWTGNDSDGDSWQLDGMVYDHNNFVQRIELKGRLPKEKWRSLTQVFGWPQQPLTIHDIDTGQFISVLQFESKIWGG